MRTDFLDIGVVMSLLDAVAWMRAMGYSLSDIRVVLKSYIPKNEEEARDRLAYLALS
jgi:hypothetical protein